MWEGVRAAGAKGAMAVSCGARAGRLGPRRCGRPAGRGAGAGRARPAAAAAAAVSPVLEEEERRGKHVRDEELSDEAILAIVTQELPDDQVNDLVWRCLGYSPSADLDPETMTAVTTWSADGCFPKWAEKYPEPPDVINVARNYHPDIDADIKKANSALVRSIPAEFKQGVKGVLRPLGWTGFKIAELTPNKTRRAQVANWLIFYREEMHGRTLSELQARRAERAAKEAAENIKAPTGTTKQAVL